MIELKRIFPECESDTLLVELLLERGNPAHFHGNCNVANAIRSFENDNILVFGVVDSDKFKKTPPYLLEFTITKDDRLETEGLVLKQKPNTSKHLIYIHPEFEPWIWRRAEESKINPGKYGYTSLDQFYKASKRERIKQDVNFKKFVNAVARSNNPAIETLKGWLFQVFN